jgi:hypothetical protein
VQLDIGNPVSGGRPLDLQKSIAGRGLQQLPWILAIGIHDPDLRL